MILEYARVLDQPTASGDDMEILGWGRRAFGSVFQNAIFFAFCAAIIVIFAGFDRANSDGYHFELDFSDARFEPGVSTGVSPQSDAPIIAEAPQRDAVSDSVGATVAQFRVDEGGNATYSIPIQTTPGVAGMVPKLALTYSSRIPNGVMGPGWALEGASQISRCRQARENGDFMSGSTPIDGNPAPVNFTESDRLCLDGVRLLVTNGAYWAANATYAPENDPFTRVQPDGNVFSVQRKDGTTSRYGDTAISANSRPAVTIASTTSSVSWNLARVQDTVGNYIDFQYLSQPGAATHTFLTGAVETVLHKVEYTGHATTPVQAPFAAVTFDYITLAAARVRIGFQAGATFSQSQQLSGVRVEDTVSSPTQMLRFYKLAYSTSVSGSDAQQLQSVKECRDTTEVVCFAPTTFAWSTAASTFNTGTTQSHTGPNFTSLVGYKIADVDGDGRNDLVWARNGDSNCTSGRSRFHVSYLERSGDAMTLVTPAQAAVCAPINVQNNDQTWYLTDYDSDGRSDLLIGGAAGSAWAVYAGMSRPSAIEQPPFSGLDSLASLVPPITAPNNMTAAGVLADLNGDGLADFVYATSENNSPIVRARLMTRQTGGALSFSQTHAINFTFADTNCQDPGTPGLIIECYVNFFHNDPQRRSIILTDINGDGRADLTVRVQKHIEQCTPICESTGLPDMRFDPEVSPQTSDPSQRLVINAEGTVRA